MVNIIIANPSVQSLTHSIALGLIKALQDNNIDFIFHDLYEEKFNPVLSEKDIIKKFPYDETSIKHINSLEQSSNVIFIYPNWWGLMPAIMKGWIDRILISGVAFEYKGDEFCKKRKSALLKRIKRAIVISTADEEQNIALIKKIWNGIFKYCGIRNKSFYFLSDLRNSKYIERKDLIHNITDNILSLVTK